MQAETIVYKNIREYRTWYREKARNQRADRNDEHFVGVDDQTPGTFGYFELVHSDKSNIRSFLKKELNMASDTQGLYEFIQNAADCGSTHFYLFHNEQYLLVLNNGFAFNTGGVRAILNIGQSSVDKQNPGKIGRYGIGFKLVHRLVGAEDGLDELLNDYAGPVLFSWSNTADFQAFLSGQTPTPVPFDPVAASTGTGAPWLFKILATCFPAMPGETVRDLQHRPRIGFPAEELADCQRYLATCAAALNPAVLAQGSLFFLRLGQGKSAGLASEEAALQKGVRSALHFLGGLQHIQVQGQPIASLAELELEKFELLKDDPRLASLALSDERDKASNLEVTFGFVPVEKATALLKEEASFYKYFPVTSETSPYTFVLHSNLLSIKSARTDLQPDKTNKALLPLAAALLHERLTEYTRTDPAHARRIWGGLLLSNEPTSANDAWQKPVFYDPLLAGLPAAVPTASGGFRPVAQVKIKQTKLPVDLAALGIAGQEWFYWEEGSDPARHAARKLKLAQWDIKDLINSGNIDSLNTWLQSLASEALRQFIVELTSIKQEVGKVWTPEFVAKLSKLRCFPFSGGQMWSVDMVLTTSTYLLLPVAAASLGEVLQRAGINTSYYQSEFSASSLGLPMLQRLPYFGKNGELYNRVVSQVSTAAVLLSPAEKVQLLTWFETLGIDALTLRKLVLFRNAQITPAALGMMVSKEVALPGLLRWAEIHTDDYSPQIEKYLLKKSGLYVALIQTLWEAWKTLLNVSNIGVFCQTAVEWYAAAENKSPLTGPKMALTASGWQATGSVYYHSKLSESLDYVAQSEAIMTLHGWRVPVLEMLPWLGIEPFELKEDTLAVVPQKAATLTAPQFAALRALAHADGTRLTDFMTVQAEGTGYRLTPRPTTDGRPQPCYTTDAQVRAVLAAHCPDLHLLPLDATGRALQGEAAVLEDAKLLTALLDVLPAAEMQSEAVLNLMHDTSFSTVVRDWLARLPRVAIVLEAVYAADHPARRILTLAADTLKDDGLAAFRPKLFLSAPNQPEFTLDGAAEADEIKVESGTGAAVLLRRSALLPGADVKSELVNELAMGLQASPALRTLLGLGEAHDHDRLQRQLLAELGSGKQLQNATQVAYVLLTAAKSSVYSVNDFEVLAANSQPCSLAAEWYVAAPAFIHRDHVLAPAFADLPKLLSVVGYRPYAVSDSDFTLFPKPYLTAEGLQAPGLRDDLDEAGQRELLAFLCERWEKREQAASKYDWPTDWSTLAGVPAAQALGFVPVETVLPAELATVAEAAPVWLTTWAAANCPALRTRFLAALGVAVAEGPLARLRQAFRQEPNGTVSDLFGGLGGASPARQQALRRTLDWLHENGIGTSNRLHQQLLTELFALLPFGDYDFGVFAYLTAAEADVPTRYDVLPNGDNDVLLNEEIHQHLQTHGVSLTELLEYVSLMKCRILDLRLYPDDWQTLTCNETEPLTVLCEFDRHLLQTERTEVAALNEWAAENPWATATCHVFTFPGQLPQTRTLLGQPLPDRRHGHLWVDEEEGHLYVSAEKLHELPELLEQESDAFEEAELMALRHALREHAAAQTSTELAQANQQLAAQKAQDLQRNELLAIQAAKIHELEQRLAVIDLARSLKQPDTHPTEGEDDSENPGDIQGTKAAAEASREAVAKAKEWLQTQFGYDCTTWQVDYSTVRGVLYQDKPLTLVVKSAKGGSLFLTPFDWMALANEKPSALLVLTANGQFRPTTLEDLERDERNRRYSLKISLNERTPERMLTALAVFYRELYGETGVQTTFKFYQPGANYTDSLEVPLRGFFGPSTNPDAGPVSAQSDDVL